MRDAYSIPRDLDGVLLIDVKDDSPFVDKLEPLTVIIEINGNTVNSIDGIEENLVMNRQNRFYIWANGKKRFVILKLCKRQSKLETKFLKFAVYFGVVSLVVVYIFVRVMVQIMTRVFRE